MNMDFGAYKTTVEVIKEEVFGGTFFRDIYSDVNIKWYRKSWKELMSWEIQIRSIIAHIIMLLVLISIELSAKHH